MRFNLSLSVLLAIGPAIFAFSQPADTQIESVADYNEWGWTSIVQQNDLITIATVPAIGARLMQFQLGEYASIYRNPSTLGDTHTPQNNGYYNYGGFKNWPIMEDVDLVRRLNMIGGFKLARGAARTSPRRWQKENPVCTTLRNYSLILRYLMGVSPHTLARHYPDIR